MENDARYEGAKLIKRIENEAPSGSPPPFPFEVDARLRDDLGPSAVVRPSMGRFTLIFTTLVTLTMINAYNFVDGADGLAGSLTFLVYGLLIGATPVVVTNVVCVPVPWRCIRSLVWVRPSVLLKKR